MTQEPQAPTTISPAEQRYRRLFESVNDAIFLMTITPGGLPGKFIDVNRVACHRLGYSREELLEKSVPDIDANFSPAQLKKMVDQILVREGIVFSTEHITRDGRRIPVEISAQTFSEGGQTLLLSIARELTERMHMETALREAEERFRTLFEQSPDGVVLLDPESSLPIMFNAAAHQQLGYTREEYAQLRAFDHEAAETPAETRAHIQKVLRQGKDDFVSWHRTKQGELRQVQVTAQRIELGPGTALHCILRDVTERKRVEEQLRKSEQRWKILFEHAPDPCYLLDLQGTIVEGNQAAERLVGYRREELLGKNLMQSNLFDAPSALQAKALLIRNAQGEATGPAEYRLRRKDRTWVVAEICTYPVELDGQLLLLGIARDITERKQAEAVVKASEKRYRQLFESVNDAIFLRPAPSKGTTPNFVEVNGVACKRLGYTREELLQKSPRDIDPCADLEHIRKQAERMQSGEGVIFESLHLAKDGQRIPVEISSRIVEWEGQRMMLSVARDLTERKAAEAALALREQQLNSFFNNATAGLCVIDAQMRFVQMNETLAQINGFPVSEHLGRTVREMVPNLASKVESFVSQVLNTGHPVHNAEVQGELLHAPGEQRHWMASYFPVPGEDGISRAVGLVVVEVTERKRAEAKLRESEEKFRQLAENIDQVFWICDKDRTQTLYVSPAYERIWGRTCRSLYEQPDSFTDAIHPDDRKRVADDLDQSRRGKGLDVEYRIVRPDGSIRWIRDRGFCVHNDQGEIYRLAGLAEDITERRHLEDQFRQAQKMEAVGQLAGGVAHDFNNILAATLLHIGLLQQKPQLPEDVKEVLKDVENEIARAANLTRQLLLFSRRQLPNFQPLDLNAGLTDLLKMLRRLLGENIVVDFRPASEGGWVKADAGMLEQVVMNLCVNARDAMPKGGKLSLTTTLVERSSASPKTHSDARSGRFVCLGVTDTGCGMPEEILSRIFEPFFTTKELGKGTGLGLATVYGIVKQHEGWIEVRSEVDKGTSFRVYFPALKPPARPSSKSDHDEVIKGGAETILLVEDEPSVRHSAALCLRSLGYSILEAANPSQALRIWAQDGQKIALLLTDHVMPESMTGQELGERLQKEQPNLKVILSSGYNVDLGKSYPSEAFTFLPKPYSTANLAKLVRRCLDAREKACPKDPPAPPRPASKT